MKSFAIILYVILFQTFFAFGQNKCRELDSLASKFYKSGNLDESLLCYKQLLKECSQKVEYDIARIYALSGESDSAFFFLNKAVEQDSSLTMFHGDNISLLDDDRWIKLALAQIDKIETKNGNIKYKDVALQLLDMRVRDQAYYFYTEYKYQNDWETKMYYWEMKTDLNKQNLIELEQIVEKIGYPKNSDVGDSINSAAFLIIQHCGNLETMKKYKVLLEECVNQGECKKSDFALLTDRILVAEGKSQIYGTQLWIDSKIGKIYLSVCEDFGNINVRRAKMELNPIEEYLKNFGENIEMKSQFENK
jgi:hypothetical protein